MPILLRTETGIIPLDDAFDFSAAVEDYQSFVGAQESVWKTAVPYDGKLNTYYSGKYTLRTVALLGAAVPADSFVSEHYGDWPSPEVLVVNPG